MRRVLLALCALLVFAFPASASPVLLTTVFDGGSGSTNGPVPAVAYGLHYGDGSATTPCIGCNYSWGLSETGSKDFDATNSPDFSAMTSLLTDGISQILWVTPYRVVSGVPIPIGSGGNPDPDLSGRTVEFFRLLVNTSYDSTSTSGLIAYRTWQIWGTGDPLVVAPVASVVPEPATLSLLGLGLGAAAWKRRRSTAHTSQQ